MLLSFYCVRVRYRSAPFSDMLQSILANPCRPCSRLNVIEEVQRNQSLLSGIQEMDEPISVAEEITSNLPQHTAYDGYLHVPVPEVPGVNLFLSIHMSSLFDVLLVKICAHISPFLRSEIDDEAIAHFVEERRVDSVLSAEQLTFFSVSIRTHVL